MSDGGDPKRLSADDGGASDQLRSLMKAARGDKGTPEEMRRLAVRLGPAMGLPDAPAPAAPTAGASAGASVAAKVAALVVAGALVGGGVYLGTRPAPVETARPASPVATTASLPAAPEPAAPPAVEMPAPAVRARAAKAQKLGELELLERAQAAVKSDPRRALALADEHGRRFPQGMLAQEREAIAVDALARLGRMDDARARAGRFLAQHPTSALRKRIETSLARDTEQP